MTELRWILLGAGVALMLGLWWRETRRARQLADEDQRAAPARAEPQLDSPDPAETPPPAANSPRSSERIRGNRRPPVIEIPGDAELDVADYVSLDRRRSPPTVPAAVELPPADPAPTMKGTRMARSDEGGQEPWVRTQPLERDKLKEQAADETPAEDDADGEVPEDAHERETLAAANQRIVALRLVTADERWPGAALRDALEGEGLRFGKYSVFHREREDGKSIFYVASMMEPGSFDIDAMDGQSFPGISLFAVLPGPIDAPTVFDMLLATARRLADRMKGRLQDEQGSTLTAQRILNLREELVQLEHLNRRLKRP